MHLAMSVDEELANSKPDKTIKTARARQAYFVRFMHSLGLDPCGNYSNLQSLLAMYTKMISTGENIVNKGCLRSDTVAAYLGEVNQLFSKRNLQKPIDLANRNLQSTILYRNIRAEENVAKQRRPLTNLTVAKIIELGRKSTPNSKEALITDLIGFAS